MKENYLQLILIIIILLVVDSILNQIVLGIARMSCSNHCSCQSLEHYVSSARC
jgi:hypothetical protein